MRTLIAILLLASCATAQSPPPDRVAGCWISRDGAGGAVTMRWLPDPARPGALSGTTLAYGPEGAGASERYSLASSDNGWSLCQIAADGAGTCWKVAQGESGSLEGGRAFLDAHGERLRISIVADGAERVIFEGARDGCD